MTFGPKFTDLHSSPKDWQLQKSCVSFGEECTGKDRSVLSDEKPFWQKMLNNSS